MNQGLHRVIFNAARGLRMVVAETAISAGKSGGGVARGAAATRSRAWAGASSPPPSACPA
ncbi:MAG: hypothetical protein DI563_23005 [Variovorax paradoxus]|uniref:ESPR domain-containing protein n=1 Tax=Variovorax paradoxus TaxID=34073 RepID=A0A2W5RU02_VARPD|nr:MAG: hypothetical protein DI563_23005 [Variovorax paradoxus]